MKTYRDGDAGYTVMGPRESLPTRHNGSLPRQYTGPAQGSDFDWVDPSIIQRFLGRGRRKALKILNDNLGLSVEYNHQAAAYELSQQAIIHAQNQAALLPLRLEEERSERRLRVLRTHGAMRDEVERRERAEVEHERRMTELKGERKSAKSRNKQAKRARRRARQAERQPPRDDRPPPASYGPDAFHRHYRTAEEVRDNLSEGERRIREIYARAAAERRQLTAEELEEVDAIADAARAAADEIRRTGASDLPPDRSRR